MKKKILSLFICVLLIITVVPIVKSLKNSAINRNVQSTPPKRIVANWTEMQKLLASDGAENDFFGYSVSIDGNTALIGAYHNDGFKGSAYVFTRTGTTWTQQAKLLASDGATDDWFAYTVSLAGKTALIGAPYDDDNGNNSGSAYVFTRIGTTWIQQAKLLASDGEADDYFGCSVSLDGNTALIGASHDDGVGYEFDSGSVYVFTRTGIIWTEQQKLVASDNASADYFGWSVSLDEDTALISAPYDDDNGSQAGSAYVFTKESGTPNLKIYITGGIGVSVIIMNNGTEDVTGVKWQIHVKGGILGMINKTVNGTIDIFAGESKTVKTGLFFGLGLIVITVKAADISETTEGIYLFIFSIVK